MIADSIRVSSLIHEQKVKEWHKHKPYKSNCTVMVIVMHSHVRVALRHLVGLYERAAATAFSSNPALVNVALYMYVEIC